MLWDWFRGILGVLIVCSKREAYTTKLSFIWVVKERGVGGGGGGGDKLAFGIRGDPMASPPNWNPCLVEVASARYTRILKGGLSWKHQSSMYSPYSLHIPLQTLKRASLARLSPDLSSAFYSHLHFTHRANQRLPFSESYIYSLSCLPQTQKVLVSSQLLVTSMFWSAT